MWGPNALFDISFSCGKFFFCYSHFFQLLTIIQHFLSPFFLIDGLMEKDEYKNTRWLLLYLYTLPFAIIMFFVLGPKDRSLIR